jgi:hypothetical protein
VLVSAISCKALTSLLTYPHEVVRARQQNAKRLEATELINKFTVRDVIQ